jgi:hypothetical protein
VERARRDSGIIATSNFQSLGSGGRAKKKLEPAAATEERTGSERRVEGDESPEALRHVAPRAPLAQRPNPMPPCLHHRHHFYHSP